MHLYVVECEDRDGLMNYLRKKKIGANLHYPLPVHRTRFTADACADQMTCLQRMPFTGGT